MQNENNGVNVEISDDFNERDYWLTKLADIENKSNIPYDSNSTSYEQKKCDFVCSEEMTAKLKHVCKNSEYMMHMVMVAAVDTLIYKYTGNLDVVVGTTIYKQEVDSNFINTILPLRNQLRTESSFKELLIDVRKTIIEADKYQNYSYDTIKYKLGLDTLNKESEIFDVVVIFESIHKMSYLLNVKPNIIFSFNTDNNVMNGTIYYNECCYMKETIELLVKHFTVLLKNVLDNFETKLLDINIISESERNLLLYDFNHLLDGKNISLEYEKETIIGLFEKQVNKTPDQIAIHFEEQSVTYSELNHKAEVLAEVLYNSGAKYGEVIGIIAERSIEMIIGILAILKNGCAYLPIEPGYPANRISFMLEETQAERILKYGSNINIPTEYQGKVIEITKDILSGNLEGKIVREDDPNRLAYIIYTSGSTGKPKGVSIVNGSIVNTLLWRKEYYNFGSLDCILQIPSFCFDSSVEDIFTPLISGSSIVMISNDNRYNLQYIKEVIIQHKITHFLVVPGFYKLLLAEISDALVGMKAVTVAGDRVNINIAREHFEKLEHVKLMNEYGPTENSVCSTVYEIKSDDIKIYIGKPIDHVQCYILNKNRELCGISIPGELYVGGRGLAKEYVKAPKLTEERFITNPFVLNEKIYKTGDLVRWMPNGEIEFLGRVDNQIKMNGFRIEIGEIENTIAAHDDIQDVIVKVNEDRKGDKYITGYIIPKSTIKKEDIGALRAHIVDDYLSKKLPSYMIPSKIIVCEKFPLLSNGKVDYKALQLMETLEERTTGKLAPRTPYEKTLCDIWAKLLDTEIIGINENFFEIGGHSVLAIQMISRINKQLNLTLTLKELFDNPVIEKLALLLENKEVETNGIEEIVKVDQSNMYPISPIQYPEWFLIKLNPESNFYNVGESVLLTGNLKEEAFIAAINYVFMRHDMFKLSFIEVEGKPYLKFNEYIEIKVEDIIDVRHLEDANEYTKQIVTDTFNHIFHLDDKTFYIAKIIRRAQNEYVFIFVTNHILWDQLSGFNMFKEVEQCYNSFVRGEDSTLEPLKVNYVDYIEWINNLILEGKLDQQKKYWIEKYKKIPEPVCLPADYVRMPIQTFNGKSISISLDREIREKVDQYCRMKGTTYQIFLLAVFNLLIHRLSEQTDFVVGTPIANRDNEDIEKMIGLFAAALPIRCTIEGDLCFDELLEHTKQSSVEAYDNHLYPFNKVIEELQCDADFSRQKVISVFFGVQNDETELFNLKLHDLDASSYQFEYESYSTHFDVTLQVDYSTEYMVFTWRYNTDLFKDSTAYKTVNRYVELIKQCIDKPLESINSYSLMLDSDKDSWEKLKNEVSIKQVQDCGVHSFIEKVATLHEDKTAIIENDNLYTYGDVNKTANKIARYLQRKGVTKGSKVAVLLEPSYEFITTVLAIIKCGACYIPLSMEYPVKRICEIYQQIDFKFLVTSENHLIEELKLKLEKTYIVNLMEEKSVIINEKDENLEIDIRAEDSMYIIFTSGSTGVPKGIEIPHKGVINIVNSLNEEYVLGLEDSILFCTSVVFDASILDIFWPLMTGFKIVILPTEANHNVSLIADYIDKNQISIFQTVPLMLEALSDAKYKKEIPALGTLKYVIVGAAVLTKEVQEKFRKNFDCKLYNHYGPTEITVDAAFYECIEEQNQNIIPIGKPIHNTMIYILDKNMKPCAACIEGELYISSIGCAKGYVNDTSLTSEHFIDNIFHDGISNKLYKTGDRGCYLEDGNIVVSGRLDNQVKINGNRVEIEEIENRILANQYIKNVSIIQYTNEAKYDQLAGFVQLHTDLNQIVCKDNVLHFYTLAQNPSLKSDFDAVHLQTWPDYFAGSEVLKTYWNRLYVEFSKYQVALLDENKKTVGVVNMIPIYWNGEEDTLPTGWDAAITTGFEQKQNNIIANTLVLIAGAVDSNEQGKGLSKALVQAFRKIATGYNFDHQLVILRPIGKRKYQDLSIENYCELRDEKGERIDRWLNLHETLGAKIIKAVKDSQEVKGTIEEWEKWEKCKIDRNETNMSFMDTLATIQISEDKKTARYMDPGIWIEHKKEKSSWIDVDTDYLRSYLAEYIPNYMIPSKFIILDEIPILESGKNDKQNLKSYIVEDFKEYCDPQNDIQRKIVNIFKSILNKDEISIYDNFFDIGGHSINALVLLAKLENQFRIKISVVELYKNTSVFKLSSYMKEHGYSNDVSSYIECLNEAGKNPLIGVPSISTSPIEFMHLANQLTDFSFYALNMALLEEYDYSSMNLYDNILNDCAQCLLSKYSNMELNFIGYSTGARVGYKIIQIMEELGCRIANFIVIDALPLGDKISDNQNLAEYANALIEAHPSYSMIDHEVKERLQSNITKYLKLDRNITNRGKINANISILCNEEGEESDFTVWQEYTNGHCSVFRGKGTHYDLITEACLDVNLDYIKKTLY